MSEDWRWTSRPPTELGIDVDEAFDFGIRPIPPSMRSLAQATNWKVGDRVTRLGTVIVGTVAEVQDGIGSFTGIQVVAWDDDEGRRGVNLGSDLWAPMSVIADLDAAVDAAVSASSEPNRA